MLGITTNLSEERKQRLIDAGLTYGFIIGMQILAHLMLLGGIPSVEEVYRVLISSLFAAGGIYGANEGIAWMRPKKEEPEEE